VSQFQHTHIGLVGIVENGFYGVDRKSIWKGDRADNTAVAEQSVQCTLWHTAV